MLYDFFDTGGWMDRQSSKLPVTYEYICMVKKDRRVVPLSG